MHTEKTYYIIVLRFGKNNENSYSVYSYQKSRRFTSNQARRYVFTEKHEPMKTGKLGRNATIEATWKIIDELKLDRKMCDVRYWFEHLSA